MNLPADLPLTFFWPKLLWLLLSLPLLIGLYFWLLRRRKKLALRFASLSIIKEAMGPGRNLRRHVPALLLLLAITVMLLAAARPYARVSLPMLPVTSRTPRPTAVFPILRPHI